MLLDSWAANDLEGVAADVDVEVGSFCTESRASDMSRALGSVASAASDKPVVRQMISPPQRSLTVGPKSTCTGTAASPFGAPVQLDAACAGGKPVLRGCAPSEASKGLCAEV